MSVKRNIVHKNRPRVRYRKKQYTPYKKAVMWAESVLGIKLHPCEKMLMRDHSAFQR